MPLYQFINDETGEIKEVLLSMKEEHVYIDSNGKQWRRVWINPNASIDTKIDPFSKKDFVLKTREKKETVGSLWDRSKEASISRETKEGIDKVKQNYYDNYSKARRGIKHPDQRKVDTIYV